jgi:mRNA-degrading endonuclease YafQ of YafQ-DinJ toxin-antitoxin module
MRVRLHKKFIKQLAKLPIKVEDAFYTRLEIFRVNKFDTILNNHSVDKVFPNSRSINITGDYRAIFEDCGDSIIFTAIGTHSELYS